MRLSFVLVLVCLAAAFADASTISSARLRSARTARVDLEHEVDHHIDAHPQSAVSRAERQLSLSGKPVKSLLKAKSLKMEPLGADLPPVQIGSIT
ncbi:MAG: hypothetical protein ACRD7E_21210, partial [Bryobacteraceae bacterium]